MIAGPFKNRDEGATKIVNYLASSLKTNMDTITVSTNQILKLIFSVLLNKPKATLMVMSPTKMGIILSTIIKLIDRKASVVLLAVQPIPLQGIIRTVLELSDIDYIVLSHPRDDWMSIKNCKIIIVPIIIPNIINNSCNDRNKNRDSLGLSHDSFVICHLASMTNERNIDWLIQLKKDLDVEILIIGRPHEKHNTDIEFKLLNSGCTYINQHFDDIAIIYNSIDCYVFPTLNRNGCIDTPISVIEAMAFNLPIVTTRFGSLPYLFSEQPEGFFFADNYEDFKKYIILVKSGVKTSTRSALIGISEDMPIMDLINSL